jgi:pimeloyl-ACP methyl ester carboxylesterase
VSGTEFFFASADGLSLSGRDHGDPASPRLPVVCLPGHTRTVRDFAPLAERLAATRRVIALDARGRGRSERDPVPARYTPAAELGDLFTALDRFGIARAVFVGTSRGGIVTALAAGARPGLVARAVLNDVGPVLDTAGLLDIRSYIGKGGDPEDWEAAIAAMKARHGTRFPGLTESGWAAFARMTFADRDGRPHLDYDPALAAGYEAITPATVMPTAWPAYDALMPVPTLLLHGEHSLLLSRDTVAAMRARYPLLEVEEVPGQGHAPLILPGPLLDRIVRFIEQS